MNKTVFILALITLLGAIAVHATVDGAIVTAGTPMTKSNITAGNATADGGNITNVNLSAETKTLAWQGFFGEVSGNVTLKDNIGKQLYSWNISNISGEVYASRTQFIDFTTVSGVQDCTIDETLTGTGNDRTNATFTNTTVAFTIGAVSVTSACSTYTYTNSAPQATNWQEIIVNNTATPSIYVTRISNNTVGYDGATHDYQLIVPDFVNTSTTTYYFFAELG